MKTSSQHIIRNPGAGNGGFFTAVEKIVKIVLKKFRFVEVGIVSAVDPKIGRVKCNLVYQGRESKWMKVFMPFASNNEGIWAMPNVGDHGLVFFILGDLNAGIFMNCSWGGAIEIPDTEEPAQAKDVIIKRNGSWLRLRPNGIVDGVHKNGNRIRISDGFVRSSTPDQTAEVLQADGETVERKTIYGQKHVDQCYHIKEIENDTWEALGFTKSETKKQQSAEIYRRVLETPQGTIKSRTCKAQQEDPAYITPASTKEETIREERIHRYADVGNTDDGQLNILNYSRTTEFKSIPRGADLAFAQGKVVEKNGEIAFHVWIGSKAFAWIALNVSEKNDQRYAGIQMQVMADGNVKDFGIDAREGAPDGGAALSAFLDTVSKYSFELEETDTIPMPTEEEIKEGETWI